MRIRSAVLLTALALLGHAPLGAQTVEGRVYDVTSGRPVSSAWIAVLDSATLIEMGRVDADTQGRFTLTRIPHRFALAVRMEGYERSAPVYYSMEPGDTEQVVFALRTLPGGRIEIERGDQELRPTNGARILGRVLDGRSGRALVGAEIMLEASGHRAVSGGEGAFLLRDIPPGDTRVIVSHLAYGTQERTLELADGGAYELTVRLDPEAIELRGIDVEVRSRPWAMLMDDVWQRMANGMGGYFMTARDFEARSYPPLNSALQSIPSVRIAQRGAYEQHILLRGDCRPAIWVDGVEIFNPRQAGGASDSFVDLLRAPTIDIEVIEVYPGPSTIPPEYLRPETRCVVAIWGRR